MKTAIVMLTLGIMAACLAAIGPSEVSTALEFKKVVIPVGKGPGSIAFADLNGDGKPDIIVANTADATVSILLGNYKGDFVPAPGSPYRCGESPNDIAIADMNSDGNPDLMIANTGTPYITILLGDGKGGFKPSPHSPFSTQSYPHVHGIAAADYNSDGKLDVVTDSWGHNQILMLLGDGAGNLILPGRLFNMNRPGVSGSARAYDYHIIVGSVLIAVIQAEAAESRRLHKLQHFLRRK